MSRLAQQQAVDLSKTGLSGYEISRRLGVSRRTVGRWIKTSLPSSPAAVAPDAPKMQVIDTPSGEYDDDEDEIGDTPAFLEDHTKICVDAYKKTKSFPAAVEFLAARGIHVTQKSLSKAVSQYATQALLSEVESVREKDFSPSRKIYSEDDNADILCISDLHAPYTHPDALAFLEEIKKIYQPRRIIGMGDELDYHAMSFHASDPDLMSAGPELKAARATIHPVEKMFPDMELCSSNHGSMAFRRAKEHGIPKHLIVPYRDALFADHTPTGLYRPDGKGNGWWWEDEILVDLPNTGYCIFVHSLGANVRNASKDSMCNIVQEHHHSTLDVQYTGSRGKGASFGMTTGCLIDDKAMAYVYNKIQAKRPLIGVGYLRDGFPRVIPMAMDRHGRWTGKVRV
jgi:hypothetical protein